MNKNYKRSRKELYLASLLYDSIEYRHLGSIKSLISEKGANPNVILPKKGISPFHLVIGCDSSDFAYKVTTLILQFGGNPNIRSEDGLTPLHIASAWGRIDLVQILLCCGGDPQIRDINHKTPIQYAYDGDHIDCFNLLQSFAHFDVEIDPDASEKRCSLVLDKIVVDNGQMLTEFNLNGCTVDSIRNTEVLQNDLNCLPKTDTTEYIMNWFNNHPESQDKSETKNNESDEDSILDDYESSFDESDNNYTNEMKSNLHNITFRKAYTKKRPTKEIKKNSPKKPIDCKIENMRYFDATNDSNHLEDFTACKDYSRESGIMTLPTTLTTNEFKARTSQNSSTKDVSAKEEKSSDYFTCSRESGNEFERNVLLLSQDLSTGRSIANAFDGNKIVKSEVIDKSTELSFVSVSEVYKYVDKDEGIVLFERRLLKSPSECAGSIASISFCSLAEVESYDTDTLRKELTLLGYNPGPITLTTKKVYVKKLHQLKKYPVSSQRENIQQDKKSYSVELEKTLRNANWHSEITSYKTLEQILVKEFINPDTTRKWREGICKSSFTYLLLDPRKTNNLPCRAEQMKPAEIWQTFLSAIFYVGKGKRARPFQHLYEAIDLWKKQGNAKNKKVQTIFDIWKTGNGVICLHIFLNVIPAEAFTREAAMISALKIENLTNAKSGEFYGVPATWSQREKKMLGVYLLYKAMMIFLNEGERQLCPMHID